MIEVLKKAAIAGGKETLKYFDKTLEVQYKTGNSDFCTQADISSEKIILEIIKNSELKDFNIYAEESGEQNKNSDYTIVIDPLDGTNNFKLGIPNWTVSIGVMKGEKIIAGVIYQPFLNILYEAELGKGTLKNGKKVFVNQISEINNLSISYNQGYNTNLTYENTIGAILKRNHTKRTLSNRSPANDFCLLAEGKIEGLISLELELYDFCAGKIIAKEAGAIVRNINEDVDTNPMFVCSNKDKKISDFLLNTTIETLK